VFVDGSPVMITTAGLSFVLDKSEKGKGTRTIFAAAGVTTLHPLQAYSSQLPRPFR